MHPWIRRMSPFLAGVAVALMVHGDYLLSIVFAVLFFIAYVGDDWKFLFGHDPATERAREDEEDER